MKENRISRAIFGLLIGGVFWYLTEKNTLIIGDFRFGVFILTVFCIYQNPAPFLRDGYDIFHTIIGVIFAIYYAMISLSSLGFGLIVPWVIGYFVGGSLAFVIDPRRGFKEKLIYFKKSIRSSCCRGNAIGEALSSKSFLKIFFTIWGVFLSFLLFFHLFFI